MPSKKKIPRKNPIKTGQRLPPDMSIPGISSDQTEAATITPEAKPSKVFCSREDISFRMKKTKAEPSTVPKKGMRSTANAVFITTQR